MYQWRKKILNSNYLVFLSESDGFLDEYSLLQNGEMLHKQQCKMHEDQQELKCEKEQLLKDIQEFDGLKDTKEQLNDNLSELQKEIHTLEQNKQDTANQLSNIRKEIERIKGKKQCLVKKPEDKSSTVQSLKHQLERCRRETQFLAHGKRNLEREMQRKYELSTMRRGPHNENKTSNPWFVGSPSKRPSALNGKSKRFQYKVDNTCEGVSSREQNVEPPSEDRNFDFEIEFSDDESFIASHFFQEK